MNLIQRAMQQSAPRPAAPPPRPQAGRAPSARPSPVTSFRVDLRSLAREGFITPAIMDSRLAREISDIKRRLLRRMAFFQPQAERSRGSRRAGNVVVVTSSMPHEGKTFMATNLALSLALEEHVEVLLIDADFARSRASEVFGLTGRQGVVDRLQDPRIAVASLAQHAEGFSLAVLPSGSCRMPVARAFGEGGFAPLLEEIAERFAERLIIIDSPPLLATTEAAVLAEQADQVVLVIEAGRTTKETVTAALELLDADDKVSLVLNRAFHGGGAAGRYYYSSAYRPYPALAAEPEPAAG